MARSLNPTKEKILVLLAAGASLIFASTPNQIFRTIRQAGKEFEKINKKILRKEIAELYQSQLIDFREKPDGSIEIALSKSGKQRVLKYKLEDVKIKSHPWDGKWRLILFDIPEYKKKARDALGMMFKRAGLMKFQKSVFISPYECRDEADFLVEFFDVRPFVRYIAAESIDNEKHWKSIFEL